jgi:hypothetical protein
MQNDRDRGWRARLQGAAMMAVLCLAAALVIQAQSQQPAGQPAPPAQEEFKPGELGYTDTPLIPGQKWRVHDVDRPAPPVIKPGEAPGAPPSDAVVLFDGKDLSKWAHRTKEGELVEPKWPVRNGYFETGVKAGSIVTRDSFGDVQLHVEWAAPPVVTGRSQGRGNSGVFLMGLYEVQVLDMYNNRTYPDGGAASLYGQWPPLVTAPRPPGEWQTYDIVFEAPRFKGDRLVRPAFMTVFWNGVLAHHRQELLGPTQHRQAPKYVPHEAELPLTLQDHSNPVRFRNIWVRKLDMTERRGEAGDR